MGGEGGCGCDRQERGRDEKEGTVGRGEVWRLEGRGRTEVRGVDIGQEGREEKGREEEEEGRKVN